MDNTSRTFIAALLDRNPEKRLGRQGFDEVKNHEFFNGLDWELVEKRKLDTSINPVIKGRVSYSQYCFNNRSVE